jgi:hypothetical protein
MDSMRADWNAGLLPAVLLAAACGSGGDPAIEAAWRWTERLLTGTEGLTPQEFRIVDAAKARESDGQAIVVVLVEARGGRRSYILDVRGGRKGWTVREEVVGAFHRQVLSDERQREQITLRLARAVQGQTQRGVHVESIPWEVAECSLREGTGEPYLYLQAFFAIFPDAGDSSYDRIVPVRPEDRGRWCYIESWTYRDGAWTSDGDGQLLREVPAGTRR